MGRWQIIENNAEYSIAKKPLAELGYQPAQ
jgi:hypothetical protein